MSKNDLPLCLPLFEATTPASAALQDKELASYPGVVSWDGTTYKLHRTEDLEAYALQNGGAVQVSFADAGGETMSILTNDIAAQASYNTFAPEPDAIARVFQAVTTNAVVGQLLTSPSGQTMVAAMLNPNVDMRLARDRYVCSIGAEAYDEQIFKKRKGKCPNHPGGILKKN